MKTQRLNIAELALTPTPAVVQCWECKTEFPVFSEPGGWLYFTRRGSAWCWHSGVDCPCCGAGELWKYDDADRLRAAKRRTQERNLIEESEADRLRAEHAGLQLKLKDALAQIALLQADLRRTEERRDDALRETAELKQSVLRLTERTGATCESCGKPFVQQATGRRARFCSAACRLRFFRKVKRNETNEVNA